MTRTKIMRLRHLYAAMCLEENMQRARTIPSSFTLLKAEYGLTGTRREVMLRAALLAKEEPTHVGD